MTVPQRLDAVADLIMGQAPDGDSYNTNGEGLPLIAGAGDFGDFFPAAKKFTTSPGKVCRPGDIILGIRATIGEKVVADREYCLGRGVAGIRAKPGLDDRYLWHWITHVSPVLVLRAKGATFKQVIREDIGGLSICLPPLPEQERIAEILDRAEQLKTKRRVVLAQIDVLTQSTFLDIFGDPVKNPKGWPTSLLGEVASIERISIQPDHIEDGTIYVGLEHIDNTGKFAGVAPVAHGDLASSKYHFNEHHVLYGKLRPYLAKIACPDFSGICSTDILPILPGPRIERYYLFYFMHHPSMIELASLRAVGINLPRVSPSTLEKFRIPLPPMEMQREFIDLVGATDRLKTINYVSLERFDELFVVLQNRAFKGEV